MAAVRSADVPGREAGLLALAALWLGLLIGVSFLATPAKFLAPSLALPVALDVGRHTFAVFNKAEWFLAAGLLLLVAVTRPSWPRLAAALVVLALLVAETAWLLPMLDQRVGLIIAGGQPPPSSLHDFYIIIEAAKLVALLAIAGAAARRLARPAAPQLPLAEPRR